MKIIFQIMKIIFHVITDNENLLKTIFKGIQCIIVYICIINY